jgi:hypothetical protein
MDWFSLAEDRDQQEVSVNAVINCQIQKNERHFLSN